MALIFFALFVQHCCFKSSQALFPYLNGKTNIYLWPFIFMHQTAPPIAAPLLFQVAWSCHGRCCRCQALVLNPLSIASVHMVMFTMLQCPVV